MVWSLRGTLTGELFPPSRALIVFYRWEGHMEGLILILSYWAILFWIVLLWTMGWEGYAKWVIKVTDGNDFLSFILFFIFPSFALGGLVHFLISLIY